MIMRDTSSPTQFSSFDAVDSPLSVRHASLDYHRAKLTASELARASLPPGSRQQGGRDERRRSRADLKKRLRQLALTSETGSASVIEVIEPNSSEEEEFKKSMQVQSQQGNGEMREMPVVSTIIHLHPRGLHLISQFHTLYVFVLSLLKDSEE